MCQRIALYLCVRELHACTNIRPQLERSTAVLFRAEPPVLMGRWWIAGKALLSSANFND